MDARLWLHGNRLRRWGPGWRRPGRMAEGRPLLRPALRQLVDFDQRDSRRAARAGDFRSVRARGQRHHDRRVTRVRREGKGPHRTEVRLQSDRTAPPRIGTHQVLVGVEDAQLGVLECSCDGKGGKRRANPPDEDGLARPALDRESDRQEVGPRAGKPARGRRSRIAELAEGAASDVVHLEGGLRPWIQRNPKPAPSTRRAPGSRPGPRPANRREGQMRPPARMRR